MDDNFVRQGENHRKIQWKKFELTTIWHVCIDRFATADDKFVKCDANDPCIFKNVMVNSSL